MKDENRKEKIERLMRIREKISETSISSTVSKDQIYRSLSEENDSSQKNINIQEEAAESIKKTSEQWQKIYNDEYIKKVLGKMAELDEKAIKELKGADNQISFIDLISREGAKDIELPLLHESIHMANFERCENKRKITYSTDFSKYEEEVKEFMDYVALAKEAEEFSLICIKRVENTIRYYKMQKGFPRDMHSITMTGNDNLKEIYESLKITYGPEFKHGHKHEMINGYSLLPTIGDNIIIEIDSNELTDKNWIYEEVHMKEEIVDEPQKNK